MILDALGFANLGQIAQQAAARGGLETCGFMSSRRGEPRRLRRSDDGVVAVLDPHRHPVDVAVDMVDALCVANAMGPDDPRRSAARDFLTAELAGACAELLAEHDPRYTLLAEAYAVAAGSHDPSTQTGAILVAPEGRRVTAANHLAGAQDQADRWERPAKDHWVVHAELGAVAAAAREGLTTHGATLYAPWYACCGCARALVAAGVTAVVGHADCAAVARERSPHWNAELDVAAEMLTEAGVQQEWLRGPVRGAPAIRLGAQAYDPSRSLGGARP